MLEVLFLLLLQPGFASVFKKLPSLKHVVRSVVVLYAFFYTETIEKPLLFRWNASYSKE